MQSVSVYFLFISVRKVFLFAFFIRLYIYVISLRRNPTCGLSRLTASRLRGCSSGLVLGTGPRSTTTSSSQPTGSASLTDVTDSEKVSLVIEYSSTGSASLTDVTDSEKVSLVIEYSSPRNRGTLDFFHNQDGTRERIK